jgi:hypothetical protein
MLGFARTDSELSTHGLAIGLGLAGPASRRFAAAHRAPARFGSSWHCDQIHHGKMLGGLGWSISFDWANQRKIRQRKSGQ